MTASGVFAETTKPPEARHADQSLDLTPRVMELSLHANAATTPKTHHDNGSLAYPQASAATESLASRVNIWIIIAILLVLFAVTRYVMHEREISHICVNDPSAPECQR